MNDEQEQIAFDKVVRSYVYDYVIGGGLPPAIAETSAALSRSSDEIRASFQRLADGNILVLSQWSGEVLMSKPCSSLPTPSLVKVEDRSYSGNGLWDYMGIPAMLKH